LQKFLFVVEIFTKYDRGLLFFAAPCMYNCQLADKKGHLAIRRGIVVLDNPLGLESKKIVD